MRQKILVSVISGQTMPNFLMIRELKNWYTSMVFITTHESEGLGKEEKSRSRWIERAALLEEGSTPRIMVREDSWTDIRESLMQLPDGPDVSYTVNLTGGTKVMTLAVYEHFARPGNRIIYVPFPRNQYVELYPDISLPPQPVGFRCSLRDYFYVHGLYFTRKMELLQSGEVTMRFFNRVRSASFKTEEIREITEAHAMLTPELRTYYSGGWFEEYVYLLIKKELDLDEDQIGWGIQLSRTPDDASSDNEYDVVFVKGNSLYVIECKASAGKERNRKQNMDNYLYKLGAITREFGLKVNSYVFTLSRYRDKLGNLPSNTHKRRDILGVRDIVDQTDFLNPGESICRLFPVE